MKSKWSKVIKSETGRIAVQPFEMSELMPCLPGYVRQRPMLKEEEEESPPPHDCSALQQQAFERGQEAGIEAGKAQCRQQVEREMQRAMALVEQIAVAKAEMVVQAETDLVDLALAIARKVLHREASLEKEVLSDAIRRILKNLSTSGRICLKIHPDEVAHLQEVHSSLVTRDGELPTIHIEADPTVGLGGCLIHTDGLFIDATIDQQLQNLREVLEAPIPSHESDQSTSTS